MQSFITELRRRNVLRIAAFYAAAGWLLVQVATQVFPFFDIPNSVVRIVVIVIALGLPVALIFAWVYELTPQGLKLESEVAADASITRHTGRVLDRWIIAVLGLAVALLLADKLVLRKSSSAPSQGVVEAPAAIDKSIAVLPFENLSSDPENAYFAEGIQDEILTRLAKIGSLRVTSRTSTRQYAARPGNLPEIAKQLGVANIVEGSVQKSGDTVRINVQLIGAATDVHLWADTYDRRTDNLFSVQSEVAAAIAAQLQARLGNDEKKALATPPTTSPEAYDAWLRALVLLHRGEEDPVGVEQGIRLLIEATRDDPDFAIAWAQLSRSHGSQFVQSYDRTEARKLAAKTALDHALQLAPHAEETQLALGYYQYWVERDYAAAIRSFSALDANAPASSEVLRALGFVARRQGHFDESIRLLDRALELDPRDLPLLTEVAWTHQQMRDEALALQVFERALAIKPDDPNLIANKASVYQTMGRLDEAEALLAGMRHDADLPDVASTLATQARLRRRYAEGAAILQAMLAESHGTPLSIATYRAYVGDLQLRAGDLAAGKASLSQARKAVESELAQQPDNDSAIDLLAQVQAALGERDAALQTIARAITLLPASTDALFGPQHEDTRARIQARFGERDAAIAGLARLLRIPYATAFTPALLSLDPDWDNLRSDPRFQQLLAHGAAATGPSAQP